MTKVKILDCTLRDGGYCNDWKFGLNNIKKIVENLENAKINIIECGFLTNHVKPNPDSTQYRSLNDVSSVIHPVPDTMYVCMINFGEYEIEELPNACDSNIKGIRVAFHKKDMNDAIEFCKKIKQKGYYVFVQPMITLNYSDEEFISLIQIANELKPYAFYIVDSFGVVKRKDLIRLFYTVEHYLSENILIGYHSHNNMQLAFSNAQALTDIQTKRNLIIDCSILGMGRGAGNLNTELFVEYLNDITGSEYQLKPLLNVIDEVLVTFYHRNHWGYSLPNYLSAKHNIHPNYASYLDSRNTLTVENIDEIFTLMSDDKRINYDKEYIENLYMRYMDKENVQYAHLEEFKSIICNKAILIIAPGKSSIEEKEKVIQYANQKDVISISINFDYPEYHCDYIFISNLRRYRQLDVQKRSRCIITSNIASLDVYMQIRYHSLLNDHPYVKDNAGMMLIKYLISLGVKKIYIAGLDGYSYDSAQNYASLEMSLKNDIQIIDGMNQGMSDMLLEYAKKVELQFVTRSKYINIPSITGDKK